MLSGTCTEVVHVVEASEIRLRRAEMVLAGVDGLEQPGKGPEPRTPGSSGRLPLVGSATDLAARGRRMSDGLEEQELIYEKARAHSSAGLRCFKWVAGGAAQLPEGFLLLW